MQGCLAGCVNLNRTSFLGGKACIPLCRPAASVTKRYVTPCVARARTSDEEVRLRSEAEAPFRALRIPLYGAAAASGTIGFLINLTQIIGAVRGNPGAQQVSQVLQSVAIDLGAVAIFGLLLRSDLKARDKQIARLSREQRLGDLRVELADGKLLKMEDLRGAVRVVILAGSDEVISKAIAAAEPFKEELMRRNVFIIASPIFGEVSYDNLRDEMTPNNLRWRGLASQRENWQEWFNEQMSEAGVTPDKGLYIGLRMDGRVRASGLGIPPWERFSVELPPNEGIWKGFGDGFDGKV